MIHYIFKKEISFPQDSKLEQAIFGMGCFWGAEKKFWELDGVKLTALLAEIKNSSFVLGFLPNLCFLLIILNEPIFFKINPPSFKLLIIIKIKSDTIFFDKFLERPVLVLKLLIKSFLFKFLFNTF